MWIGSAQSYGMRRYAAAKSVGRFPSLVTTLSWNRNRHFARRRVVEAVLRREHPSRRDQRAATVGMLLLWPNDADLDR